MQADRPISPSQLSIKDLPWQIDWNKDKCTLCGQCTTVCPVKAIELGVFRKREIKVDLFNPGENKSGTTVYYGISQKTQPEFSCIGCGMCTLVCPNNAIIPMHSDEPDKLRYHSNTGGVPRKRGEEEIVFPNS